MILLNAILALVVTPSALIVVGVIWLRLGHKLLTRSQALASARASLLSFTVRMRGLRQATVRHKLLLSQSDAFWIRAWALAVTASLARAFVLKSIIRTRLEPEGKMSNSL
jgi:hypothetical protein